MSTAAPPLDARPEPASRPGGRLRARPSRALVGRVAAAVAVVLLVAYGGICFRYADTLSRVERRALVRPPTYVAATHEPVTFAAADGMTLRGWWFDAQVPRQRAVVIVHGKDRNRVDSAFDGGGVAKLLLERGYSALLFDLRGHGESDGLRWGLGKQEALDVAAAVDLAAKKANVPRSRVALIAESMGAGSAALALDHVPDVGPVVLDSVYTSATTVIDEVGPSVSGLPSWFTPGMVLMARAFFDLDVDAVQPIREVRERPGRPFLFIQCLEDKTVAPHHGFAMKAASAHPATQLWTVPGCGHVRAFQTQPAEWASRVTAFLEEQLGK